MLIICGKHILEGGVRFHLKQIFANPNELSKVATIRCCYPLDGAFVFAFLKITYHQQLRK